MIQKQDQQPPLASSLPAIDHTRSCLLSRERMLKFEITALLAVGLPACFFGPIILSSIYWFVAIVWSGNFSLLAHWSWFFFGSIVILIPLLLGTEIRTRGRFLDQAVLESRNVPIPFLTGMTDVDMIIQFAAAPRVPSSGLVEFMLWGPRQVLDALEKIRHAYAIAPANRILAADILVRLCAADHLSTADPVSATRPRSEWCLAIAYLLVYDWIAVSADAKKMWISTESRNRLGI